MRYVENRRRECSDKKRKEEKEKKRKFKLNTKDKDEVRPPSSPLFFSCGSLLFIQHKDEMEANLSIYLFISAGRGRKRGWGRNMKLSSEIAKGISSKKSLSIPCHAESQIFNSKRGRSWTRVVYYRSLARSVEILTT